MISYEFNKSLTNIFEIDSFPHLTYIQKFINYHEDLTTLHQHINFLEILFISEGFNSCYINNQSYRIKRGDLAIINSDILHNVLEQSTDKISGYILGIDNLKLKNTLPNKLINKQQSPIIHTAKFLPQINNYFSIFDDFLTLQQNTTNYSSVCLDYLLQSLLVTIYEIISSQTIVKEQNQDYHLGERIKEYIDTHFLEDITLKSLSKALNISEYYLSRTCKKFLGYSPVQYITKQRLKEAQNLLLTTDLTITEIAFHCGYNNSNYFQSVFSNNIGMTPGKYRKSWK